MRYSVTERELTPVLARFGIHGGHPWHGGAAALL